MCITLQMCVTLCVTLGICVILCEHVLPVHYLANVCYSVCYPRNMCYLCTTLQICVTSALPCECVLLCALPQNCVLMSRGFDRSERSVTRARVRRMPRKGSRNAEAKTNKNRIMPVCPTTTMTPTAKIDNGTAATMQKHIGRPQ
jgi:hypothetical protein